MNVKEGKSRRFGAILGALVAGALVGGTVVYLTMTARTAALHYVIFQQIGCPPANYHVVIGYFIPWSVTMSGVTKVQPPNTSLPLNGSGHGTENGNFSTIIFSVPDGTYNFTFGLGAPVSPLNPAYDDGVVVVNGSDVIIQLALEPPGGC